MRLLVFIISYFLLITNVDLEEVRQLYKVADLSQENATFLHDKLENITKSDEKVLVAYKGAVTSMTAKYEKNVKLKKEVFEVGVNLLEFAITSDPDNIEIRFVRMSVQQNSPKILNYHKEVDEDKKYILNNFNQITEPELSSYIKDYILSSNNFTEEEKNVISQP
jgi:transposase-like protein